MEDDLARLGLIDEGDIVLDEAALSLARLDHAHTDLAPYEDRLAEIAERLALLGEEVTDPAEQAALLARVIAEEGGFSGDRESYDDPDNADLIRVIDRRRGLPVSLSILYVAAARRVGWSADVLDLPGHVLVLVGQEDAPVIIDPFRDGARVTVEGVAALLASSGEPPAPVRHVAAMPNRAILVRLLLNQATRAEAAGKGRRALTLYRRMTAFAPGHAPAWWERARLELVDGDVAAAQGSLTAMLETTRDPEIRERITTTLAAIAPK